MSLVTYFWLAWALSGPLWFLLLTPSAAVAVCALGAVTLIPALPTDLTLQLGEFHFDYAKHHAGSLALLTGGLTHAFRLSHTEPARAGQANAPADLARRLASAFRLADAPMVLWCCLPLLTSAWNQTDFLEHGIGGSLNHLLYWGVPYAAARCVYRDRQSIVDLLQVILVLAILYLPLCIYESIVGPEGYLQVLLFDGPMPSSGHAWRMGGWRPHVMFANGIRLGRWMAVACLAAFAMALSRSSPLPFLPERLRMPVVWTVFAALTVLTLHCRSFSWLYLLVAGILCISLFATIPRRLSCVILVLGVTAIASLMTVRMLDLLETQPLLNLVRRVSPSKVGSLEFRLRSERIYIDMTLDSPYRWLGSDGVPGRYRYPYYSDQRYIHSLKNFGMVGLAAWLATLLFPLAYGIRKLWNGRQMDHVDVILCSTLCFIVVAVAWDCLFNAFMNPVFYLFAGCLVSWAFSSQSPSASGSYRIRYR